MAGQKIGALWKPRKDSAAIANGVIDLLGMPVRVSILPNDKEKEGQPDFKIVSFPPELFGQEKDVKAKILSWVKELLSQLRGGNRQDEPPPHTEDDRW